MADPLARFKKRFREFDSLPQSCQEVRIHVEAILSRKSKPTRKAYEVARAISSQGLQDYYPLLCFSRSAVAFRSDHLAARRLLDSPTHCRGGVPPLVCFDQEFLSLRRNNGRENDRRLLARGPCFPESQGRSLEKTSCVARIGAPVQVSTRKQNLSQ